MREDAEYRGEEAVAINVSPNGVPGMVFHQNNMTPTSLAQQVDDFYHEQAGYACM